MKLLFFVLGYIIALLCHIIYREQNDNLMSSIRDCHNSISKLKSGSDHKMDIFGGQWMISLVDAIKNNRHRFHQQPMGPLGSMVTIKDQKWTIAIQQCIGTGNLHAFVVDNANDGAILRQIMKEVFQCEKAPLKLMPFIIQYHYSVSYITGWFACFLCDVLNQ